MQPTATTMTYRAVGDHYFTLSAALTGLSMICGMFGLICTLPALFYSSKVHSFICRMYHVSTLVILLNFAFHSPAMPMKEVMLMLLSHMAAWPFISTLLLYWLGLWVFSSLLLYMLPHLLNKLRIITTNFLFFNIFLKRLLLHQVCLIKAVHCFYCFCIGIFISILFLQFPIFSDWHLWDSQNYDYLEYFVL